MLLTRLRRPIQVPLVSRAPRANCRRGGNLYALILMMQFSIVITIHLSSGCVLPVISLETYETYEKRYFEIAALLSSLV